MRFLRFKCFILILFVLQITSCTNKNLYRQTSHSASGNFTAVIEIKAGTNLKYEYDQGKKKFIPDQVNGKDRIVNYLPYPVNYGFIPSTYMDTARGGDGDPLDVLVLCSALKTGTVIEVIPVAMMQLIDAGEIDDKIIAIPADKNLQTINSLTLSQLNASYKGITQIIETWFLNYKGKNVTTGVKWFDEKTAAEEIKNWSIPVFKE